MLGISLLMGACLYLIFVDCGADNVDEGVLLLPLIFHSVSVGFGEGLSLRLVVYS